MATSSSGSNVNEDFQQLMQKLAGIEPLEAREELRVEKMAAASINRIHREPLKKVPHNYNFNENTERIGDMYKDGVTGLTKLGWMEFPHSLGSGRYGSVTLGMRLDQGHLNPEERQLCGIKVQEVSDRRAAWTEIMAMKCLTSHEHIIEYYDHFLVGRRLGWEPDPKEDTTVVKRFARSGRSESPPRQAAKQKKPDPVLPPYRVKTAYSTLWIVMEFGDAGTLWQEISRYPGRRIPESGVLYYVKQVLSGIAFMHTRKIVHGDLHLSNVLLNFNPDRTKRCLINDFGRARLHPGKQEFYDDVFQWAQAMVYLIACGKSMRDSQECRNRVRGMGRSAACLDILFFANNRRECPKRVSDLLKIDWFKGDAAAPLPTTARHVQRIASQIPKSKSMEEYLDTQKARSRDLIPSDVESERRRSSHELYAARRESPISPPMKHVRLPAWTRETVSHVIPEDEEVDLPRSSRAWGALRVPQASVTGPTRSEESFPRQRVMIKPPVSYPEPEPLMPAAEAAVAEGLQQHRENRGSLGARIRRSVSSLGQRVRSLNCFARHGH